MTEGGVTLGQTDNYRGTNTPVWKLMKQDGIAWQSDIDNKFKNIPVADRKDSDLYLWQNEKYRFIIPKEKGQAPIRNVTSWTEETNYYGVQDEHFIVWMRTAGLPNFRKLYGRFDEPLKKGQQVTFLVSSSK